MDELHGLNVKPVEWTTKFAFEAPTARQRAILSTASAVGFIGQQHHAAYLASKGGYDFAHQGYGYRLGPILPSRESDSPGRNMPSQYCWFLSKLDSGSAAYCRLAAGPR